MLGAAQVLGHRTARARVAALRIAASMPRVLRVGGEHLGRVGDVGGSGRSSRPGPRSSRRPGAWLAGRLGQADVEAHVGLAVGGEVVDALVHRADELGEHVELRRGRRARRRARRRRARPRGARRRRRASSRAAPRDGPRPAAARRRRTCRRRGRGRRQVAALHERGQRLAQRRARDPSCSHSSRSAGSRCPARAGRA